MKGLLFIHRGTTKEIAVKLFDKLNKEYPNGTFENRGANIYGKEPENSRDFLAGFCYAYDHPKPEK